MSHWIGILGAKKRLGSEFLGFLVSYIPDLEQKKAIAWKGTDFPEALQKSKLFSQISRNGKA